jgi:predicted nucleic acid-binding protein
MDRMADRQPAGPEDWQAVPEKAQCIVPTIVQLELSKWLVREVGEDEADQMIAYTQKCVVVPLDTTIALLAADLHREHKLATADAIVYATARRMGAGLLTCDAHFEGCPTWCCFRSRRKAQNRGQTTAPSVTHPARLLTPVQHTCAVVPTFPALPCGQRPPRSPWQSVHRRAQSFHSWLAESNPALRAPVRTGTARHTPLAAVPHPPQCRIEPVRLDERAGLTFGIGQVACRETVVCPEWHFFIGQVKGKNAGELPLTD